MIERASLDTVQFSRVAALAVTLLLHGALIAYLIQYLPKPESSVEKGAAIAVTFIERPRPPVSQPKPELVPRPSTKPASTSKAALRVVNSVLPAIEAATLLPPGYSSVRAGSTLDLSIAEPDFNLGHRDPLKRPDKRRETSLPRVHLRMTDSSFSGRLQAMQKSGICGELRAALIRDSGSAAATLASMAEFGCKI